MQQAAAGRSGLYSLAAPARVSIKESAVLRKPTGLTGLIVMTILLGACSSTYYRTLESVGIEKRDILVERVEDARDAQDDASEQFASALDQFRATVNFDGGDLEQIYDRLNSEYEDSVSGAEAVRDRIDSVQNVAEDLFAEWEKELDEYSSPDLRRESAALLSDTRRRYGQLMKAMRRAEGTMEPVLEAFQDQVLYLKHNLNARAIGALRNELGHIERDTATLIEQMRRAIAEADAFIDSMKS
jgi:methyl-accepting chemotaxis protein